MEIIEIDVNIREKVFKIVKQGNCAHQINH